MLRCHKYLMFGSASIWLDLTHVPVLQSFFHGVPMIVIPLYGEQPWNARQAEHLGAGIGLDIASPIDAQELAQQLSAALANMLATDAYALKAQHVSKLMRKQRWSPMEKAASTTRLI